MKICIYVYETRSHSGNCDCLENSWVTDVHKKQSMHDFWSTQIEEPDISRVNISGMRR
jgi:hypothetical protein